MLVFKETEQAEKINISLAFFLYDLLSLMDQVSRGSAGDYQADEQAGVAGVSWRL